MRDIILNFDAARGEFEMFRQIPHQGKHNARCENDRRKNGSASIQVSSNPFNHFFFFFSHFSPPTPHTLDNCTNPFKGGLCYGQMGDS